MMKTESTAKELDVKKQALKIVRRQQALLAVLARFINEIDSITEDLENLTENSTMMCELPKEKS